MKAAALGRILGIGNITLQDNSRMPPSFGIRSGDGRHQGLGIRVFGCRKKGLTIRHLDDFSQIHDRDRIADVFYHSQVMGNKDV